MSTQSKAEAGREKFDKLMNKMSEEKQKWTDEKNSDDEDDETGQLLDRAIELAIEQGRGWSPGEKEAYLEKILDDEFVSRIASSFPETMLLFFGPIMNCFHDLPLTPFILYFVFQKFKQIPPLFAQSAEEVEKTGLAEAFTQLKYDDSPTNLMLNFRKMGNESFANGKRNQVNNKQYFRDAINHYYEALAWAQKVEPMMAGDLKQADTDDETYTEQELDELKSTLSANAALSHLQLKNWGYVRDDSKKVGGTIFISLRVMVWTLNKFRAALHTNNLKNENNIHLLAVPCL